MDLEFALNIRPAGRPARYVTKRATAEGAVADYEADDTAVLLAAGWHGSWEWLDEAGSGRSRMGETKHKQLDVVQLSVDVGRWAAGPVGTVVEVFLSSALVEISDEHGPSDDFLTLPHDVLRPVDGDEQSSSRSKFSTRGRSPGR